MSPQQAEALERLSEAYRALRRLEPAVTALDKPAALACVHLARAALALLAERGLPHAVPEPDDGD